MYGCTDTIKARRLLRRLNQLHSGAALDYTSGSSVLKDAGVSADIAYSFVESIIDDVMEHIIHGIH